MTSCSKMFYNRTGFIIDIDLNTVNVAVGHIGDREVNDSVSAKERKRTDWAIILHTIYISTVCILIDTGICAKGIHEVLEVIDPFREAERNDSGSF